jgi:hypothetical protein
MRLSVKLLTDELESSEKAKQKSIEMFANDSISVNTHKMHIKNLDPQIEALKHDIKVINDHYKAASEDNFDYNHDRPYNDFAEKVIVIRKKGFKPIAVSQMLLEDTFVFETAKEALEAYNTFECDDKGKWIGKIQGWWYGKKDFEKSVEKYENDNNLKVRIHWLEENSSKNENKT